MFALKIKAPKIKVPRRIVTKKMMLAAGTVVVNNYRERIHRGKGVENRQIISLKPLSEVTIATKGSSIPLMDKGTMAAAFRIDRSLTTTDNKAVFNFPKSEAMKAGVHQKGATIRPKKKALKVPYGGGFLFLKKVEIPARPHVGFSDKDLKDAHKIIELQSLKVLKEKLGT